MSVSLRPYQLEAIEGARAELRRGAKKTLIICPTGGGKTVIASKIIQNAVERRSRTLFLAHRRELITQTVEKLARFGIHAGVIQSGFPLALHRPAQVASVQTLIRRPGQLADVDLIFVDEAHHVTSGNTYSTLLSWWPKACVVGLTATPWRLDGRGLGDVFDSHVVARTPRQLRDEGFLVPVGGWEYEAIDTSTARVSKGDYVTRDLQDSASSRRVVGDVVSEYVLHGNNARAVLFALNVEHSELMTAAFNEAGVPAAHVDGEMPAPQRDAILARFRKGSIRVVSNCNVLTEGWDVPEAEVCILCRPTLSTSLALQMIGRVLRTAPGKVMARIHDHAGVLRAHGHPYTDRDYSPETSARVERKKVEGGAGQVKRCPSCKSVLAGWPCDSCGFSPTPTELRLEFEEAAHRKEIGNNGTAAKAKSKTETDFERREKWKRRYAFDDDFSLRREFFERMAAKHGPRKGAWVYSWVSGGSERPKAEWFAAAKQGAGTAP